MFRTGSRWISLGTVIFLSDYHNNLWNNELQRQLLSRPVPGFTRKVWEVLKSRTQIASTDCCMPRMGVILRIIIFKMW